MNRNQLRTVFLLGLLTGLILLMGQLIGGSTGVIIAFFISVIMNFAAYYQSDKYALRASNAQPLNEARHPELYRIVGELAKEYGIPMPKLWYIPTPMANAFATGRNPENGHVAVTDGIMRILDERELRGVLAHELGHIKNRDILVSSMAVTIAGAIGMLANSLKLQSYSEGQRGNLSSMLIAMIMPVAASIIHMGISRSREYYADESGAHTCKDPLALASALKKLDVSIKQEGLIPQNAAQVAAASLYIVYPFAPGAFGNLFSTHPPMRDRIARLMQMAREMGQA